MQRVVLVIDPEHGHLSDAELCAMRLDDVTSSVGTTWTDHYLLQATVPFIHSHGALVMYVGHPDLSKEKPLNRLAMKLLQYLSDVCAVLPAIEIRGRAILCVESGGDMSAETISLVKRILGTKRERQLPPEVDAWIEERELRDVSNFPPALQDMHRLLLPRRQLYGRLIH